MFELFLIQTCLIFLLFAFVIFVLIQQVLVFLCIFALNQNLQKHKQTILIVFEFGQGLLAGDWRLEAGGQRLEAGGCRLEAAGWRLEAGGYKMTKL